MTTSPASPTGRFSDRVDDYVRYRPGYPQVLLDSLAASGQGAITTVADIGSGTGISTALLLSAGWTVFAVEPNEAMRAAAEMWLAGRPGFHSVVGTAEATTLPSHTIDLVTAGQAFHWFDRAAARQEFQRILVSVGRVALFWNSRRLDDSPFARAYETLLRTYGTDYTEVTHRRIDHTALGAFFGGPFDTHTFATTQTFDFDGLRGRLLSSSYAPAAGHPRHDAMMTALQHLFDEHQHDGRVDFQYDTHLYLGSLA